MTREQVAELLANQAKARERGSYTLPGCPNVTITPLPPAPPDEYEFEIAYPPSVNAIWRTMVMKGKKPRPITYLTHEGKEYRAKTQEALALQGVTQPLEGPVAVELRAYRPQKRGDLDNIAKAVLDALKGRAFVDDSQVVDLHMKRFDDKDRPRVEVVVWAVSEGA